MMTVPREQPWWLHYMRTCRFSDGGRDGALLDCFGLLRLVYQQELGITLSTWPSVTLDDLVSRAEDLTATPYTSGFTPVETGLERAFDAAVIRRPIPVAGRLRRGWWHVGVVTRPGHLLHIDYHQGPVEVAFRDTAERLASPILQTRHVRLFRHAEMLP